MHPQILLKSIQSLFKGKFELPYSDRKVYRVIGGMQKEVTVIHMVPISSGNDSTATALALRALYPEQEFVYFFSNTQFEVKGTDSAIQKLKGFLGAPIIDVSAPLGLIEQIDSSGGFLPSQRQRSCTSYQKIHPMQHFMTSFKAKYQRTGTPIHIVQYVGVRADETDRKGAELKGDTETVFPLVALGLDKAAVNKLVERTVGIPAYYYDKSRSGCTVCIFMRRMEIIAAWRRDYEKVSQAADREGISDDINAIYQDLPTPVSKIIGEGRNHITFVRPQWLGHKAMGYQSGDRGKKSREHTMDMFSNDSIHVYAAVEYEYTEGFPGMCLPQVYFERLVTYSTSLAGIKKALKFFWLHRCHTKELHQVDNEEQLRREKQIAIIQIEIDGFENLVPAPPKDAFTWQSDKKPLRAIRKTALIIEHILLCEGLRQSNHPGIDKVEQEYGRVLHFEQYMPHELEELVDDIDVESAPQICNVCSR